jgi:hypothetical protein
VAWFGGHVGEATVLCGFGQPYDGPVVWPGGQMDVTANVCPGGHENDVAGACVGGQVVDPIHVWSGG